MLVAQTELAGPDFGDEAALDGEIVGVGAGEGAGVGAGAGGVAEVVAPTLSPARRFRYEFARLGGVGLGGGPSSSSFVDLGLVDGAWHVAGGAARGPIGLLAGERASERARG